jgi:hypothetical protein
MNNISTIEINIKDQKGNIITSYTENIEHDYITVKRLESALCLDLLNGYIDDIGTIIKRNIIKLLKGRLKL